MFTIIVLATVLFTHGTATHYRFDYEFSELAGYWLKFHEIPATWDEARMRCHTEGAVLASPLTMELKAAILAFVKNNTSWTQGTTIFSGVHSTFSKGDYSSIEGVPLLRLPISWSPGEPDNYGNSESCLAMSKNGDMADVQCDNLLPYVCYKKFSQMTITACGTTDPEYILDSRTGSCYKMHMNSLVWSDAYMTCVGEGGYLVIINNDIEAALLKDIYSKHTSSPLIGIRNWGLYGRNFMTIHGETLEKNYHTWAPGEPNNLTNTQIGEQRYTLEFRTGSCYKFHRSGLIWSEAYMTCMAEGGYLAIINDDKEAAVVKEIFSKYPDKTISSNYRGSLAVGFRDWGTYGKSFMTIHGESLENVYHIWLPGQPDNATNVRSDEQGEYCGSVFRNGMLDDVWCTVPLAFLCEKDPTRLLSIDSL